MRTFCLSSCAKNRVLYNLSKSLIQLEKKIKKKGNNARRLRFLNAHAHTKFLKSLLFQTHSDQNVM